MKVDKVVTSLYLDKRLVDKVKEYADQLPNETFNSLVRKFILEGLIKLKKKKKEDI